MSDRFTGGDNLTDKDGLKYYIHKTMMLNELSGGAGAYKISNAQNASSGPSFGAIQYDLGANQRGRNLFESIATAATNADGTRIISEAELKQIKDHLYKPFNRMSADEKEIYDRLKPKMDQALASAEGKSQINADYSKVLDTKVAHVNSVVDNVTNPTNKAFLQGDLKSQVMIADIANQYGSAVNRKLSEFLNQTSSDAGVTLPGDGKLVKVSGSLDADDIHRFRLATEYGVNHPADANRRDKNIDDVVGSNKLSVATPDSQSRFDLATVKVGNEQFTIASDPAGIMPASIFRTPEATPPALATLTKFTDVDSVEALLKTGILTGKGEPVAVSPTPGVENRLLQQPAIEQPRMPM
jgi:hypothetical protein